MALCAPEIRYLPENIASTVPQPDKVCGKKTVPREESSRQIMNLRFETQGKLHQFFLRCASHGRRTKPRLFTDRFARAGAKRRTTARKSMIVLWRHGTQQFCRFFLIG